MMPEDLKALCYAIHDAFGYGAEQEARCRETLRLLNHRGWFLLRGSDLDDSYRQGLRDAVSNPEFADEYVR